MTRANLSQFRAELAPGQLVRAAGLEGATLRQDLGDNATLYGKELENRAIVTSGIRAPTAAAGLLAQLNRFSPREGQQVGPKSNSPSARKN